MDAAQLQERVDEAVGLVKKARDIEAEWAKSKAKDADFEPAADEQKQVDDLYDRAAEIKKAADTELERLKRQKAADGVLELGKRMKAGTGGLPVGVTPNLDGAGNGAGPQVVYKSRDGEVKTATPVDVEVPRGGGVFKATDEAAYAELFRRYLMKGRDYLEREDRDLARQKSLSVGLDSEGGFLTVSEVFRAQLIEDLADAVLMRRLGNVLPPLTNGDSVTVPAADSDLTDAEWTSELQVASADTATPFGGRNLRPYPLMKLVKISESLLRRSALNAEAWVRGRTVRKFEAAEETAFMTGSGAGQPEGLFTSSRPTIVTAAGTSLVPNDILDTVYGLKAQYKAGASWLMHRTVLKTVRKLVINSEVGNYVWMPGLRAGEPDTLAGFPVWESEYAPSSIAASQKVAAFGNYREAYWIVDSLAMRVQRLVELYAGTNEVGFKSLKETDGMVVNGNPLVILQMAAS